MLSCEAFVAQVLCGALGAKAVFCGPNFTFGSGRAGDAHLLRKLCAARGIEVHVVPLAVLAGAGGSLHPHPRRIGAGGYAGGKRHAGAAVCGFASCAPWQGKWAAMGLSHHQPGYPRRPSGAARGVYISRVTLADGTVHPGATGLGSRPR